MSSSDHDVFPMFEAADAVRVGIVIHSNVGTGNGLPDFKPLPLIIVPLISLCLSFPRCKMGMIIAPLVQCLVMVTIV